MGDELSPLAYPWRSSLAKELDIGSYPGFSVHTGRDGDYSVRFVFPDSILEINERSWMYHRGEEEVSAKGLQNGKLRTAIVLCHEYAGASHHVMASSSLSPRHNTLRASPARDLPLYELSEDSSVLAPLAVQEHLVWRINSAIEGFNGRRTVTAQNDAWVDSQGHPVATVVGMRTRRVSMQSEPSNLHHHQQQQSRASTSGAAARWSQGQPLRREVPGVCTGVRPWQFTPHFPLADSRLSFTVHGHTLIASCKTLTDAKHLQEDVKHTLILFAFVIAVNWFVTLRSGPRNGNLCQAFPATLIFIIYVIFALARTLVRKYLKPQLLVSPHGWLVSYSAFRRPDLPGASSTHEDGDTHTYTHDLRTQTNGLCSTRASYTGGAVGGGVGGCASPRTSNEACTAGSMWAGDAGSNTTACMNAGIHAAERNGSSAAVQDATCMNAQHSTGLLQRGLQGGMDSGGPQEAVGMHGGWGSVRSRRSMHAGHECSVGTESQASSYGQLPASHGATNCAPGASLASLAAPMHAGHGMRAFSAAMQHRFMQGGWLEGVVRTFMEICGRGESLAAQGAFEAVLGAKVVAPSFPLQPHQATVHLYTASGAHPLATFLNPSSFWPASNPRALRFALQDAETLVATINRHLESLGVRVPLQNDSHVTCMTDLVRHPPHARLGMHALRSEHALWRIAIFLIVAAPLLYFILRIHLTIACMLVLALTCALYDSIAPAMHVPCDPDDAAVNDTMHTSHAHRAASAMNTTCGAIMHAEDACSTAQGSRSLDVPPTLRQHSNFPCIAHHNQSQQDSAKGGGFVGESDAFEPLLPGQVQTPSDWGSRVRLNHRDTRGLNGAGMPQRASHEDLMVCQRAEIRARNYMRRVHGRNVWESARMHSLAPTLSFPHDPLGAHAPHAYSTAAVPVAVAAQYRPLQNFVSFPFPSSFGADSSNFFFPPVSSCRSTGAELPTAASGDLALRRVSSQSGLAARATLRGDLVASAAPPLFPHSLPRTSCTPPFPPSSPALHPCASTGHLYGRPCMHLPTSRSTSALSRMVRGSGSGGGGAAEAGGDSECSPSASGAAPRPPAPRGLPHSRSTSHLPLTQSRASRPPMHTSHCTSLLAPTGGANFPEHERQGPPPPPDTGRDSPTNGGTSGGSGGRAATSSSVSMVPQLGGVRNVSTGAQACPNSHRRATLETRTLLMRPASSGSLGPPPCLSALSSPTLSPVSPPEAPVDTCLAQSPQHHRPSEDSPPAPSPTPPTTSHEHNNNHNHRNASDGSGAGGAATHSAAPPNAPVDTRQYILEASGCSNVDLSTEVRVLCRARGCVRLAFPARPYVHFSVFASTLLWASTLGLCVLALSSRIKWKESWLLRLLGYESRSLGACCCVVLAFWVLLAVRLLFPEQDTVVVDIEGVPADISHYVTKPQPTPCEEGGCSMSCGPHSEGGAVHHGQNVASHMHGRWSVSKMPRWWPEASCETELDGGGLEGVGRGWRRWFAVSRLVSDAPIACLLGCQVHVPQQRGPTAGQPTCLLLHYSPPKPRPRRRTPPPPQQQNPQQPAASDCTASAPLLPANTAKHSGSVAAAAGAAGRRDTLTLRLTDPTNSHFLGVPGCLSVYDKLLIADLINACIAEVDGRDSGTSQGPHMRTPPASRDAIDSCDIGAPQQAAHDNQSGSDFGTEIAVGAIGHTTQAQQQGAVGHRTQALAAPRLVEGGSGDVLVRGSGSVGVCSSDMHAAHDCFGMMLSAAAPVATSRVPVPLLNISVSASAPHRHSGALEASQVPPAQLSGALQAFALPRISTRYSDTTRTSSEGVSTRSLPDVATGPSSGTLPCNVQSTHALARNPSSHAVSGAAQAVNSTPEDAAMAAPATPFNTTPATDAPSPCVAPLSSYRIVLDASVDLAAEPSRTFTVTDHLLSYRVVGEASSSSMDTPSAASDDAFF